MNTCDGLLDVFINGCNVSDVVMDTCDVSDVCINAFFHVFDVCMLTREMSMLFV
jgi:hypothetical protein